MKKVRSADSVVPVFRVWGAVLFAAVYVFSPSLGWSAEQEISKPEAASPKEITIGFIPGDDVAEIKKGALELAKKLQEALHVHTNVLVSKNYQSMIDDMAAKKVDFGFFTAMSFVFAEKQAGAKVLMKKIWTQPYYYSAILTLKSKKISKVQDLKGKSFAFVDEKSTSGYLYPMVMFQKKSIDPKKFFSKIEFAGNHQAAVDLLVQGKVDAIATFADDDKGKKNAWSKFLPKKAGDVRVLWVSEPIPNDPFAVRQDFYDEYPRFTHDLMFALIDLKGDVVNGKNFFERNLGFSSLDLATTRQYEPVREMVKTLNLKLE